MHGVPKWNVEQYEVCYLHALPSRLLDQCRRNLHTLPGWGVELCVVYFMFGMYGRDMERKQFLLLYKMPIGHLER
jgi:hypothetical protein